MNNILYQLALIRRDELLREAASRTLAGEVASAAETTTPARQRPKHRPIDWFHRSPSQC
jgi:hypothetical protein